jgi:hypothetical protein
MNTIITDVLASRRPNVSKKMDTPEPSDQNTSSDRSIVVKKPAATSSHVACNMEKNSATLKNNIRNIRKQHLQHRDLLCNIFFEGKLWGRSPQHKNFLIT